MKVSRPGVGLSRPSFAARELDVDINGSGLLGNVKASDRRLATAGDFILG
ncbi:hypothetical protein Q31a_54770 [Aureliella helgolandensis]|uniref:Uncharacterized protein n=1 Tax=Aureliella helgolandensis TaxID=2527968 RepID=A0A518GEW2_9BACT|nr:hypothetical protein Q31a_54770 [Aureliella helgolandensis]